MKISFLYGVRLDRLIALTVKHGGVDWKRTPTYIVHLFYGIVTLFLSIPDLFWRNRGLPKDITFIVGHYRSGTTHLHNLFTEEGSYRAPSNYQCIFPHSFLSTEYIFSPILNKILPKTRPMDNMAMEMGSPQEEEIAMAAMGAPTPYLSVHFPKNADYFKQLIDFNGVSKRDLEQWKKAHMNFLRKLAKRYGPDQALVLKSPTNTARIKLLMEMHPNAKFVYIHRDPYRTIRSSIHLYSIWYDMDHFQSLDTLKKEVNKDVLDVYEKITNGWFNDAELIPADRRISISFQELQENPVDTMGKVYQQFGKSLNTERLEAYLNSIRSYKKNSYNELDDELLNEISLRFKKVFDAYGYEIK